MMSKTNFMHIRGRYDRDITVAYQINTDGVTSNIHWGYAVCSSKDQFNKKIGRAVSEGRLVKHPGVIEENTTFDNRTAQDILVETLDDCFNR